MSKFIRNKSCDMCRQIEKGLTEMEVGKTKHYLCYECMAKFAFDVIEFASMNLTKEFEKEGYTICTDNNYGFIVRKENANESN
jgi:hypothetical protein